MNTIPIVGMDGVGKTTLARLLYNDTKVKDHFKSRVWVCVSGEFDILKISRSIFECVLSYNDLTACLKRLFAYCSLFPKDYLFDKEDLVMLWMAEGFLHQPTASTSTMECLGHDYFEELLSRSFLQHAPDEESLFVMHDLMNDLATSVVGDFFMRLDNELKKDFRKDVLENYSHMSFVCEEYITYICFGEGFVNIIDFNGGKKVGFGSVASGSKLQSEFIKSVKEIPYNISVVEIDLPIIPPGILTGGAPVSVDLRSLLETAGCKTFARLITDTGVLKIYETMAMKGLTVFAPSDDAFTAVGLPDLNKLTNAEIVSLLLFHASSDYIPDGSLTPARNPIETLASPVTTTTAGKYELNVEIESNNSVTIVSGIDSSRVENTALDSIPLSIYKIENVLLAMEIFAKSPASVPSPAPEIPTPSSVHSPASSPVSPSPSSPISPSPSPISSLPSPSIPPNRPTPSISSPIDAPAPADIPAADDGTSNAGDGIEVPVLFVALVMMLISGIISSIAV